MKILVACEFSNVVANEFRRYGHYVVTCDLIPNSRCPEFHYQGDVLGIINQGWDMMIAFPPCTHLAVSGARHFKKKIEKQRDAINFFLALACSPIEKICIENPVGIMSTYFRKPDQIIHPYYFGDPYEKKTCLWLKNLPKLIPTDIVAPEPRVRYKSGRSLPAWYAACWCLPAELRSAVRSLTFPGLAKAMADQWGQNS